MDAESGVHQTELELQNEELHNARRALEASRARYLELYDYAPVGYCMLNLQGLIYGIARPMPADELPAWAATWQPDAVWRALPVHAATMSASIPLPYP